MGVHYSMNPIQGRLSGRGHLGHNLKDVLREEGFATARWFKGLSRPKPERCEEDSDEMEWGRRLYDCEGEDDVGDGGGGSRTRGGFQRERRGGGRKYKLMGDQGVGDGREDGGLI